MSGEDQGAGLQVQKAGSPHRGHGLDQKTAVYLRAEPPAFQKVRQPSLL